jgi:hypothetical protein
MMDVGVTVSKNWIAIWTELEEIGIIAGLRQWHRNTIKICVAFLLSMKCV